MGSRAGTCEPPRRAPRAAGTSVSANTSAASSASTTVIAIGRYSLPSTPVSAEHRHVDQQDHETPRRTGPRHRVARWRTRASCERRVGRVGRQDMEARRARPSPPRRRPAGRSRSRPGSSGCRRRRAWRMTAAAPSIDSRDRQRDHQAGAQAAEQQAEHDHHQQAALEQVEAHRGAASRPPGGAVVDHVDLDVRGQHAAPRQAMRASSPRDGRARWRRGASAPSRRPPRPGRRRWRRRCAGRALADRGDVGGRGRQLGSPRSEGSRRSIVAPRPAARSSPRVAAQQALAGVAGERVAPGALPRRALDGVAQLGEREPLRRPAATARRAPRTRAARRPTC
jgi:hypothetical protein